MKDKKKIILSVLCVLSMILIALGITVAVFTYTKTGDTQNTITAGKLTFLYTENTGTGTGINITNAFPVSDTLGKAYSSDDSVFDFKVESEVVGEAQIPYEVTVKKSASSTLEEEYVKLYLTDTTETEEAVLLDVTKYSELPDAVKGENEKQIYFDTVEANEDYEKDFRLRMWVSDDVSMADVSGQSFTITVNVYSDQEITKQESSGIKWIDSDSDSQISIGDQVNLGTEQFYVIETDSTQVKMLAKYNLYVGGKYDPAINPDGRTVKDHYILYTSGTTNMQDSTMGSGSPSGTYNGGVYFAEKTDNHYYWTDSNRELLAKYGTSYPAFVYDENSELYNYVEGYARHINNKYDLNVTATLMTNTQAENLGCNANSKFCGKYKCTKQWEIDENYKGCGGHNIGDIIEPTFTCEEQWMIDSNINSCGGHNVGDIISLAGTAPEWVYSETYWLANAISNFSIAQIQQNGVYDISDGDISKGAEVGVRPVIIIAKSVLEQN